MQTPSRRLCLRFGIASVFVLLAFGLAVNMYFSWGDWSSEQRARTRLNEIAIETIRSGNGQMMKLPAFSYDFAQTGSWTDKVKHELNLGAVTDVAFLESTNEQLRSSVPELRRLTTLRRILLYAPVGPDVIAEFRASLPNVELVDEKGLAIP